MIIKAVVSTAKSVLEEQWREYFICDALADGILLKRGYKRISARSANTRKDDGIITNGSILSVADGQCAIVVSQGKVINVCYEPGEHVFYDPSHSGGVEGYVKDIMERLTFGGGDIQPRTHRLYYINTKEQTGNRFVTPYPIPVAAGDDRFPLSMDASLLCKGSYSFRITDAEKFYRGIAGNIRDSYDGRAIKNMTDSLLLTSLQTILSEKTSEKNMRPSDFSGMILWVRDTLKNRLTSLTMERYGIEIVSIGIDSFVLLDAGMIQELQAHDVLKDPQMAIAYLSGQTAEAMIKAASNQQN